MFLRPFRQNLKEEILSNNLFSLGQGDRCEWSRSAVHIIYLNFRKAPDSVLQTITLNTLGKYDLDYKIIDEAEQLVVGF